MLFLVAILNKYFLLCKEVLTEIIGISLVMSPLWRHVKVLKLHINMQLAPDLSLESRKELAEFAVGSILTVVKFLFNLLQMKH